MYESNHVNKGAEFEHGKHHLICYQRCKSLIDVRETIDDVNGSQGIAVQSVWYELMS